jgi:outer membrane protein OmpA-like peptidoglycan-associated protein
MNGKNIILRVLLWLAFLPAGYSQTYKAYVKAADESFQKKDYYSSLVYNLEALAFDTTRIDRIYAIAEAARHFNSYKVAEAYYQKVVDADKKDQYSLAKYYLAAMKQAQGKYAEAKTIYEMYLLENRGEDAYITQKADKELKAIDWAMSQVDRTVEGTTIQRLGDDINTGYSEFGAIRRGDSLIYSSLRFELPGDKSFPKKTFSNLLLQSKGVMDEAIKPINDPVYHTAHTALNSNGTRMYYTLCEYLNAHDIRCDLYYRDFSSQSFSDRKKLPDTINAPGKTNTQPNLGIDPATGTEILYWVSDRVGGKGKLDIWYAPVTGDTTFGIPMNLAAVNTAENDITPFYHIPTGELYFSTDGRIGMGGYDVYKTVQRGPLWLEAEHLGVPINSSYHDVYFTLGNDGKKGLLSSNRLGSLYLEPLQEACCYDLYDVDLQAVQIKLIVKAIDKNTNEPLYGATIRLRNLTDRSVPDIVVSHPNDNEYTFNLDRNKDYIVIAEKEGYRPDSVNASTFGINRSQDIEKKVYLETDKIDLEVLTFDKKNQTPLQGVEVTLIDVTDNNRVVTKFNADSNDFHFPLTRGHQYKVIANKKGYMPATVDIDTRQIKANKITERLYLDIGDIYKFLPLVLFFDNDQPDIRSYKTKTDKSYSQTYPPYYARKEEYKDQWSSKLSESEIPRSNQEYENFFNDRLKKGNDDLSKFLDILISMLERGDKFEIFLKGYASPRATSQYNLILGQRRIFSVKNELLKYQDGILKKYLDNKQLVVSEKSFGEMTAPKTVNDQINNQRLSIFSLGASNERRVEIVDVKDKK